METAEASRNVDVASRNADGDRECSICFGEYSKGVGEPS